MALRLNPPLQQPDSHEPELTVFPELSCPTFFVPLDKIYEIAIVLSPNPAEVVDCVDIILANPPALPFDIPTILSPGPADALDIPTILSPDPTDPVDIPNILANPPADALDISNQLSGPPADPVDIPNPLITPPPDGPVSSPGPEEYEDTFADSSVEPDVVTPRLPPETDVRRHPPAGQEADTTVQQFEDIIRQDENGESGYPSTKELTFHAGYLDPRDDINLQANIIGLKDVAKNAGRDLVDPFRLIKLGLQLNTGGLSALTFKDHLFATKVNTANLLAEKHSDFIDEIDGRHNIESAQADKGLKAIERNNLYSPSAPYNSAAEAWGSTEAHPKFDLEELNDASKSTDNNRLFLNKKASLSVKREARTRTPKNLDNKSTFFGRYPQGGSPGGQIPARFDADRSDGSIITKNPSQSPHELISDNESHVPLSFTDLRPLSNGGSQRTVYFRPFITSLNEDLAPEWDKKTLYGRTDQVVNYMSTIRTIFIGFELHAFYPDDLKIMYSKLKWLTSLVYPEYDNELLLKSGPVCRMRVGDVISGANKQGLSGIIDSLSYDYTDSIWEIKDGEKVPRSIKVSISFHVLHEKTIGRDIQGNFGNLSTEKISRGAESLFAKKGLSILNVDPFRGINDTGEE